MRNLRALMDACHCGPGRIRLGKLFMLSVDLFVLWAAFSLARLSTWVATNGSAAEAATVWWHRSGEVRVGIFAAIAVGMVLWFWGALGHYSRMKPYWDEVRETLVVVFAAFLIDAMIVFIGKWDFSRAWLLSTWAMLFVLLPLSRLLVKRWINKRGWLNQPYVIIGSGEEAIEAAAAFESEPLMGFRPVALITPAGAVPDAARRFEKAGKPLPEFALTPELEAFLKIPSPLHIVIVLDNTSSETLKTLAQRLTLERDDVFIVPPLNGLPLYGMELSHFFSHEVLLLRARNNLHRRASRYFKRAFDVVGALSLLILLSPFFLLVALQIRRESRGPVLFTQPRVGYDGHHFEFIKFRSMVVDADEALERWKHAQPELWQTYCSSNFKLADDPRVTRVGRWIRRTSVDELPQLWNVLKGDMSLVGPRPLLPRELDEYGESINIYHYVRPGITGLWQISGRSSTTFEQRIAMDRWYIRNWSLWSDLVILIRTVRVVLRSEGAY